MMFSRLIGALALVLVFQFSMPSVAAADEVLDWNTIGIRSMLAPPPGGPAIGPYLQGRSLAIVHISIFDAVNGINRRYTPIHVDSAGPSGASQKAAAVQAAYRALITLFPGQAVPLDTDLAASLAKIALTDSPAAIDAGRNWGDQVALAVTAWRQIIVPAPATPYVGCLPCSSTDVGKWRPTPPGFLPMAAPLLWTLPTFAIPTSSSFRPVGPPSLKSPEYTRDFLEVKRVGEIDSVYRTADQTLAARFWAGTASPAWNRAAQSASLQRKLTLSANARLFALLNIATADALLAVWDAKYHFSNWRPITAIRLADTDGNPRTAADPGWTPLIVTPPYPDYVSGHQGYDAASEKVLTSFFGIAMGFETFSDLCPQCGLRSWKSFGDASDEAFNARIWSGIHFRFAQRDSRRTAERVAQYVLQNVARPWRGKAAP